MGGMVKLKILNKSIYKFSMHYLGDENERTLLYKRWTTFKRFNADTYTGKKNSENKEI